MIREAVAADIPAVIAMGHKFIEAVPALARIGMDATSTADLIERLISGEDSTVIVGEADGAVVGMLAMLVYPYYFNPAAMIAQELFWWVEPEHRNSGLASRLLRFAEQWARGRGVRCIHMIALDESDGNGVAGMYVRRGYAPVERAYMKEL